MTNNKKLEDARPNDHLLNKKTLNEFFDYHKDGYLIRKKRTTPGRGGGVVGKELKGSTHKSGYKYFRIFGKQVALHRAIFSWHYGFLPKEIDHINRLRSDNRIENLRASTRSENTFNTEGNKNKTGVPGIFNTKRGYRGIVVKDYKRFYTNRFVNIVDAIKSLSKLQIKVHGYSKCEKFLKKYESGE